MSETKTTLLPYGGYAICSNPRCRSKAKYTWVMSNGARRLLCDAHAEAKKNTIQALGSMINEYDGEGECSNCGSDITEDHSSCPGCGTTAGVGWGDKKKSDTPALDEYGKEENWVEDCPNCNGDHLKGHCTKKANYIVVTEDALDGIYTRLRDRGEVIHWGLTPLKNSYIRMAAIIKADDENATDVANDFQTDGEEGIVTENKQEARDLWNVLTGGSHLN